jgi:NAD(P)-dependent dehydrogenase (short-subunit alcohol dehydrogenase family)
VNCRKRAYARSPFQADQARTDEVANLVRKVAEHFGHLDILVNNAGVFITGPVGEVKEKDVDRQFAINVGGVNAAVREAAKIMTEGGRIISIGSMGGTSSPWPGISDYSATKAAVAAYTRGWARDLGPKGITVNVIEPGPHRHRHESLRMATSPRCRKAGHGARALRPSGGSRCHRRVPREQERGLHHRSQHRGGWRLQRLRPGSKTQVAGASAPAVSQVFSKRDCRNS